MTDIRPFERADLPAVIALLETHMRSWTLSQRQLGDLILDDPWADEELPSLVAVDDAGEIVGFTGVQARRMRVNGRPIRAVHSGHGVVKPDRRGGAVGALLIGRALSGPQDFTWSDGTIDPVAGIFRTYGGQLDHSRACDWMLVLRPARWLGEVAHKASSRTFRQRSALRSVVPVGALPFQSIGSRTMRRVFGESSPMGAAGSDAERGVVGEDVDTATIVQHLPSINKHLRVWIDHDEEHLEHLFRLVRSFGGLHSVQGPLFCRLVRRFDRPVGWYAYVARRGGASRVLHLAALERETDAVLGELIAHARDHGSAALAGRAEPHLQRALTKRLAVLGYARQPTFLAKDGELAALIATSSSLVTRLDGDLLTI